jgi:acyl-CoA thioesterase-1
MFRFRFFLFKFTYPLNSIVSKNKFSIKKAIKWVTKLSLVLLTLFSINCSKEAKKEKIQQTTNKKQALKIVIIGDSLTEGYGVKKSQAYPAVLQSLLIKSFKNIEIINAGSSGSTTASAKKRLQWHLKSKPKIVMFALGGNDGLRGLKPESSFDHLKQAIELTNNTDLKILLAEMKIPTNYGEDYRKSFESIFKKLSQQFPKITLIPFMLEGVGANPKLNLADGIHPNIEGHKKIAKNLYPYFERILKHVNRQ